MPFGSTRLLLIATETPEGLLHIKEIAGASPRIAALSWGIEDLSAAMGLPRTRDQSGGYLDIPRYARVMCAVAASAAGVEALDTVYTDIPDLDGLRRECREGVAMGFSGKISIHPTQIEVINAEFTPSKADAEEAVALIAAFEEQYGVTVEITTSTSTPRRSTSSRPVRSRSTCTTRASPNTLERLIGGGLAPAAQQDVPHQ
ncbi:CoA ester lyase, partial [bacterium]|nr:CoA ester lyase [bacterium]